MLQLQIIGSHKKKKKLKANIHCTPDQAMDVNDRIFKKMQDGATID